MSWRIGLLAWLLAGPLLQAASDSGESDSEYTGLAPTYPRAKPVVLPSTRPASSKPAPPPAPAVVAPPPEPLPPSPPIALPPPASPAPVTEMPQPAPAAAPAETAPPDVTPPSPSAIAATAPPMDEAEGRKQVVVVETSLGRMIIELDDVAAPRTCGNFRKLVSSGFYNHTIFHRVIPRFMIQGGDPITRTDDRKNYGQGDPGYTLPAEIGLKASAGAVAMARLPDSANPQRDSNGSQFFICVADCPSLDDQYTIFGHVIRGLNTASEIASQPRDAQDDPDARIEMQASLETKKQALDENPK